MVERAQNAAAIYAKAKDDAKKAVEASRPDSLWLRVKADRPDTRILWHVPKHGFDEQI